jgi:hypothetical protein
MLKNRYICVRHGESQANIAGLIVSDPNNGVHAYGLTDDGRSAVGKVKLDPRSKVTSRLQLSWRARRFQMQWSFHPISSVRRRRLQSSPTRWAARPQPPIHASGVQTRASDCSERFFGTLELGPNSAYEAVWRRDEKSETQTVDGVESVARCPLRACCRWCGERREVPTACLLSMVWRAS